MPGFRALLLVLQYYSFPVGQTIVLLPDFALEYFWHIFSFSKRYRVLRNSLPYTLLCLSVLFILLPACRQDEKRTSDDVSLPATPVAEGELKGISNLQSSADTAMVHKSLNQGNAFLNDLPDSAIVFYLKSLSFSRQLHYTEGMVSACNNLIWAYRKKGDTVQLRRYRAFEKNLLPQLPSAWFNPGKDAHIIVMGKKYDHMASAAFASGHYDTAAAALIRIIHLKEQPDTATYTMVIKAYLGLGAIASRLNNEARAMVYFNQAEKLALRYKDTFYYTAVLTDKASFYLDRDYPDTARALALAALQCSRSHNSLEEHGVQNTYTVAASFLKQNHAGRALAYSKESLRYALATAAPEQLIQAYYVMGYNYVRLGQYKEAEVYLQKGLRQAEQSGINDNVANAYGQLAAAYEGLGAYKKALIYEVKYAVARDSLLRKENVNQVTAIETRYRVARKERELAQKDKMLLEHRLKIASQRKQQYIWVGGTVLAILAMLLLLRQKRLNAEIIRLKATVNGEEQERKRMAKELHDGVVNRLSILKMNFSALPGQYSQLAQAPDYQDMIIQLEQGIAELRDISHNLLPDILQRAGLEESLKVYCEKITKATPLQIDLQWLGVAPRLNDDFQLNIYRIVQELVGNVIKHARARNALVQFNFHDNSLDITIDDDGVGLQQPEALNQGIGFQNLRDRIRLLNGSINIERRKGTSVYLAFPI